MKVYAIKEIREEVETKHFQFKTTTGGGCDILYTAVILDDDNDALVYWISKLQGEKMLHMWYSKEKVEQFLKEGSWKVVSILDK